jgi:hypothetical protein
MISELCKQESREQESREQESREQRLSQQRCQQLSQQQRRQQQQRCSWNNVVVPVLYGLREAGLAKRQLQGDRASTVLGQGGYNLEVAESRESKDRRFGMWIGQKHIGRRVLGRVVSNGVAVVVGAILAEAGVEAVVE